MSSVGEIPQIVPQCGETTPPSLPSGIHTDCGAVFVAGAMDHHRINFGLELLAMPTLAARRLLAECGTATGVARRPFDRFPSMRSSQYVSRERSTEVFRSR
jgi:hypothetical protein